MHRYSPQSVAQEKKYRSSACICMSRSVEMVLRSGDVVLMRSNGSNSHMTINTPHKISQITSTNYKEQFKYLHIQKCIQKSWTSATILSTLWQGHQRRFVKGELSIDDVKVVSIKLASVCHSTLTLQQWLLSILHADNSCSISPNSQQVLDLLVITTP